MVVSCFLDKVISSSLEKSNTIAEGELSVWNDILNQRVNADIIIQGSSRAWVHFDPSMITDSTGLSCYNIGVDGHHFLMQDIRFKILEKYNHEPKLIIHSLETSTLSNRRDLYNSNQFLPYMLDYSKDFRDPLQKFNGFVLYDFYIPLIRYYGNYYVLSQLVLNRVKSVENAGRIKGFRGKILKWNDDLKNAKAKFTSKEAIVDRATFNAFNAYLVSSKKKDIQVVLVYPPEYIEGQGFISNRGEIINMYQELSKKYDIPFIDFSNNFLSYKREYFYNSTHMNKEGAELFTAELIKIMKERNLFAGLQ